eukprot:CAMPEP_0184465628 /NCGR_PEP_ID=MMETSP0740-20130409/62594_1 /TAXON_ID=385413 /ORGANISM="Thalassiosira miniscula, Strain CCMP1093" /LENGTH=38 /DNA_ID= /DNA_START= /DNA_END= /DNA_ORIENTATION=
MTSKNVMLRMTTKPAFTTKLMVGSCEAITIKGIPIATA